jgi:hypothetical protein
MTKNPLKYSFNAICQLEEDTGLDLASYINANFGPAAGEKPKFTPLRKLYHAGLIDGEPNLTLTEAGIRLQNEINQGKSLEDIIGNVYKAVEKAMPEVKTVSEKEDKAETENP